MTNKKIQQILEALKEGFQTAGTPVDDETLDFAKEIAKKTRFLQQAAHRPEQLPIAAVVIAVLSIAKVYDDLPEEKWIHVLEKMKQELPYMVRSGVQGGVKVLVKGLPKRPSTGRTAVLKPREQKRACKLVSRYHHDGDSMRVAYEKVAGEMECSPRTIQRVWQQRRALRSASKS